MKLSTIIVSFNHESYISEAINSVLIQDIDCDHEILIADDCSTDNTLSIISSYCYKYQNLIKILPTNCNLGITKNYQRAFSECRGEYIAILEGDDVWTSPSKLRKQMSFLDEHNECSFCFNKLAIRREDSGQITYNPPFDISEPYSLFTANQLILDNFIGNFSACMYRKSVIDKIDAKLYDLTAYDWMINIVCAEHGFIGYIPEVMSLYRLHSQGKWTSKTDRDKALELISLIDQYNDFLGGRFKAEFEHQKQIHQKQLLSTCAKRMRGLRALSEKLKRMLRSAFPRNN